VGRPLTLSVTIPLSGNLLRGTSYKWQLVVYDSPAQPNNMTFSSLRTFTINQLDAILYVNTDGSCGEKTPCYDSIQEAIDAASTGSVILIAQGTYDETLVLDESKALTLQGGWDSTFTSPSGETKTNSMTITDGTVVFNEGCLTIGE